MYACVAKNKIRFILQLHFNCSVSCQFTASRTKPKPKKILLPLTTMATTVMASSTSKILARQPVISAAKHRPCPAALPMMVRMDITAASLRHKILRSLSGTAAAAAVAAAVTPLPALAEQIEKAQLFDFNLTLPAIAIEFLLLMVALDKVYFTPLGKFMDERDAAIRAKLGDVKDTSSEVKQLEEQAAAVMRTARAEVSAALNQMKKETAAELEAKLAEGRNQVEAELAEALASLEKQKEETMKALDTQIAALSDEIVKKVLPGAT